MELIPGKRIEMFGKIISMNEDGTIVEHGLPEEPTMLQPAPEHGFPAPQAQAQEVQIHRVKLEIEGAAPSLAAMLGNHAVIEAALQQKQMQAPPMVQSVTAPNETPEYDRPARIVHPNQINLAGLASPHAEPYVMPVSYVETTATAPIALPVQERKTATKEDEDAQEPRIKVKKPNYFMRGIATIGITSALLAYPAFNVAQHGKEDAEECSVNPVCIAQHIGAHALVIPDILDARGDKK